MYMAGFLLATWGATPSIRIAEQKAFSGNEGDMAEK